MPLTIRDAATFLGRHVKTLQLWDKTGKLKACRSATNRRYYEEAALRSFAGLPEDSRQRKLVAYCRVSSQAQKPDLKNQIQIVQEYCSSCGHVKESLSLVERIFHCDHCGLNLNRDLNAAKNILAVGLTASACGPEGADGGRKANVKPCRVEAGTKPRAHVSVLTT